MDKERSGAFARRASGRRRPAGGPRCRVLDVREMTGDTSSSSRGQTGAFADLGGVTGHATSSHQELGGPRAGAIGGSAVSSPRWARMGEGEVCENAFGSVMNAVTRSRSPHRGHCVTEQGGPNRVGEPARTSASASAGGGGMSDRAVCVRQRNTPWYLTRWTRSGGIKLAWLRQSSTPSVTRAFPPG